MVAAALSISASRPQPASPVATLPAAVPPSVPAPAAAAPPAPSPFHALLSELNPLQYVPVVGTIYRAVTGDTIPETARFAGGLVVSGLTGGPVGIAMNLGATLLEHLVGIDPEQLGDRLLAELGIGHAAHSATPAPTMLAAAAPPVPAPGAASDVAAASASPAVSPAPASAVSASPARAWSPAQLAAYGVTGGADGTLRRGTLSGADVLNSLELSQIATPAQA